VPRDRFERLLDRPLGRTVVVARAGVRRRDELRVDGRVVLRADDCADVRELADRRGDAPAERGEDRLVVGTVQ
jgi:hypothetical protein